MRSYNSFGARMNNRQTQIHKTYHGSDLGEANTFPLIVFSLLGHEASTQMSFCLGIPKWDLQIPKIGTPVTLESHNFVCKSLIEVNSKAML